MKKKKIFKIILFIICLIIFVYICWGTCARKTKAHDLINITDGIEGPNPYQGLLIGYSLDLGEVPGIKINASIGDNAQDIISKLTQSYGAYVFDENNMYLFLNTGPGNNNIDLAINFYYTLENGNPTQTNMQILVFEEDTLKWQITQTYGYYSSFDKFIMFYWRPYTSECNYQLVQFNDMTYETTKLNFNEIGQMQTIPMYDEDYISSDYDENDNNPNMFFKYLRSNIHSNEIMFISNVITHYDLNYWINSYNSYLTNRYNYLNDLRITGYRGGYNFGYSEGASANETQAFNDGKAAGYQLGLEEGYAQGMRGDNAVSSAINVLKSVFSALGAFFSIELFPHITIGLFLLVPLFFSVLGFILWIWRKH